jgi:hypothetical protein
MSNSYYASILSGRRLTGLATLLLLLPLAYAAVVDRVAIVIGKQVVTESEVVDDLRLTEFINNEPLDLGSAPRRAAAEHLVDQELIRRELDMSGYSKPPAGEADTLLRKFREGRFHSLADYRAALRKYGVTESQLKQRLLWQLTAIRFIDFRFGSQQPEADSQSAERAAADAPASSVDQQMDAWLKQTRADTKVTLKPEAFQ